jgi:hypothetical protein
MNMKYFKAVILSLPLLLAGKASGAVITWAASAVNVNTSNQSQVSTAGNLFAAVDINSFYTGYSYTVNGVIFKSPDDPANANVVLGHSGQLPNFGTAPGTGALNDPNPINPYAYLLNSGTFNWHADLSVTLDHTVQLSNLLAGHTYQLQIWTPYWNGNYPTRFDNIAPDVSWNYVHAGTSPAIDANESPTVNVGDAANSVISQYILGTFIADGNGQQTIYYYGGDPGNTGALIGAMQIRSVPEPTAVALLAISGLALAVRSRIRQRKLIN